MRVGDLIYDNQLGQTGLVLERVDTPPEVPPWATSKFDIKDEYYVTLYADGDIEGIFDDEVEVISDY